MILVDTNALTGLVDERDGLHRIAVRDLKKLAGQPLGVSSAVLAETFFLLTANHLRRRLEYLLESLAMQAVELSAPWWQDVFAWAQRYAEHEPDLADAQLAVLCSRDASHQVWTYDKEFSTTWRLLNGKPIPVVGKSSRRSAPKR
jgi:predicted nucleic acid-binding protein